MRPNFGLGRFFVLFVVIACSCGDKTGTAQNSNPNAETNASTGGGRVEDPNCADGLCTCSTGLVLCGDLCVDVSVNVLHCGGCNDSCGSGAAECVSGSCECATGAVECGNSCVDLSIDHENCGRCGNDCNNNEECISGQCEDLMCGGGLIACQGECVNAANDERHCGECGTGCFGGETCQSGVCACDGDICAQVGNVGRVVGGGCSADNPCADGSECLDSQEFPGGTCSTTCQATEDCPAGTACVFVDGQTVCLLQCGQRQGGGCRGGYDCDQRNAPNGGDEVRVCIND